MNNSSKRGLNLPIGYVNHNRQKVIQVIIAPGIDLGQSWYRMLCQNCNHTYQVGEAEVRPCTCPRCQRDHE